MDLGVNKFTKGTPPKKTLMLECLTLRSYGMRSCNFLRLMSNKITSRSYSYFFKFLYFFPIPTGPY
jgi:hypothetical protein